MKSISLSDFIALIKSAEIVQQHEMHDTTPHHTEIVEDDGDLSEVAINHTWGAVWNTLQADGIEVIYEAGWSHPEFKPEEAEASTEGLDVVWTWKTLDFDVIDEDGDILSRELLQDWIADETSIDRFDLSALGESNTTDIDIDEASEMETITLEIDNAPNIRFTGELIAKVSSSPDKALGSNYSGQTGRWTELTLYKTRGGKFVCHQIGRTQWQGERDRHTGKVCETLAEVKEFFGHRWLAKDLYDSAKIDTAEDVD